MRRRWLFLATVPVIAGLALALYGSVLHVRESAARMN